MNDNQIIDGALNYLADFVKNYSAMAGTIKMFAGSVAPDGWLLCNGQAVSRITYSKLFNVIGTTYGEGDGSTTFNVPDLRGRTPIGVGTGTATNATAHTLGQKAGVESSSYTPAGTIGGTAITQAQLPAISATVNVRNVGNSSYNTLMSTTGKFSVELLGDATRALALDSVTDQLQKLTFSVGSGSTHTHSWTGTATTINKMQPYLAVNYIICTGDDLDLNPSTNPEYRYGSGTVTVPVAASGSPLVLLTTLSEGLWEVKLRCTWPTSAGTVNKNFGIYRTDLGCGSGFYANASSASTGHCADTISRIVRIDGTTPSEQKNVYLYAWQGGNSEVEVEYSYQVVQLGGVINRDYDYPIGEIRLTSGTASAASATSVRVKIDTLPKGVWLISSRANFAANTTGERSLGIWLSDIASTGYARVPAVLNSSSQTSVAAHRIVLITLNTVDRDIEISFWQNSGSSLEVSYTYKATQIGGEMIPSYQDPVEYVNDYTMMMNRLLEMSVTPYWSSGTCIVTGSSNYDLFLCQSNLEPMIVLRLNDTLLQGFCVSADDTSHWTRVFMGSINGDVWSLDRPIKALRHTQSSNHNALSTDQGISKVIGLIPRHDAIADIQAPLSNPMTDFIISQGSVSNGWGWRKWNSGRLEQWGLIKQTNKSGTAFGNMYYATYTGITYPIPFINLPALTVTPYGGTMGILGNITHTETGITSYDMYRANAGVVGGTVSCYATGTWK